MDTLYLILERSDDRTGVRHQLQRGIHCVDLESIVADRGAFLSREVEELTREMNEKLTAINQGEPLPLP